MKPKISIIGGGIAGLTTAIALNQRGFKTEIFEAAPEIKGVGAGLALAANAMRGFDQLGLMKEVVDLGRILPSFSILDQKGKVVTTADSGAISQKWGIDNFLIHRADLHNFLMSKIDSKLIHTGKRSVSFQYVHDKIEIIFADATVHLTDYLIVADGIHSVIRSQLLPEVDPRYAGYTCWRAVIENTELDIVESSETWGRKGRFGIAPLSNNLLYWFACINAPEKDPRMKAFTVSDLKDVFNDYHHPIPDILDKTSDAQLLWNDILDLQPLDRYAFDRILLLGDAGHATTPNMGQGACQAIEDAVILGEEMTRAINPQVAFQAFEKRRLKRTHYITKMSWQVGKVAQLENPLLCSIRNFAFRNLPKRVNERQVEKVLETDF